jgi:hypothetical protein
MNLIKFLFINLLLITLYSCQTTSYKNKIIDNYYLSAMDADEDMEIIHIDKDGYMISIIRATVFAVGKDENFIIVKQHPKKDNRIDKKSVNYFIIPLKNKKSNIEEKNIIGPLSLKEFNYIKDKSNISNINFDIVFRDLE